MGALSRALAANVSNLHLQKRIVKLDLPGHRVDFADGTSAGYEQAILTLPLTLLADLVDDLPAEVAAAVAGLRHNSILCINLGVDRPAISDKHWVYFYEKEFVFFRISFPMNYGPTMAPPGKSSISAEIAYYPGQAIDRERAVEDTIAGLRRSGVLLPSDTVEVINVTDITYAYPIYDHARPANVATIHAFLRPYDVIPAGRYGEWAYYWMDDSILSGRRAAAAASGRAVAV
jgi:protoporphyrinogen oxidase